VFASSKSIYIYLVKKINGMLMQPLKALVSVIVFILVFITSSYSQTPVKTYDKEWKKVEEFLEKQLF
jgi:hypothetical protein